MINRCEYPSRNPTSPLDCRAADRFSSLPLPALYFTFPAPLPSLFYAGGRPRHSDTSAHYRRRRRHGWRTDGRRCVGLCWTPGGLDCGFVYSLDFGSGARITSHGTKKPAFFHVIRRFVSPGVLTPVWGGIGGDTLEEIDREATWIYTRFRPAAVQDRCKLKTRLAILHGISGDYNAETWVGLNGDQEKMLCCTLEVLHRRAMCYWRFCTAWNNASRDTTLFTGLADCDHIFRVHVFASLACALVILLFLNIAFRTTPVPFICQPRSPVPFHISKPKSCNLLMPVIPLCR